MIDMNSEGIKVKAETNIDHLNAVGEITEILTNAKEQECEQLAKYLDNHEELVQPILSMFSTIELVNQLAAREGTKRFYIVEGADAELKRKNGPYAGTWTNHIEGPARIIVIKR